jgi:DNA-directed RNA polymerase subunit K/omega
MKSFDETTKEDFTERTNNIYEAILVMGLRARQINQHQKDELDKIHEEYQAELALTENEEPEEVLNIPSYRKPTIMAVEEMLQGKIVYNYLEPDAKEEDAPTEEE